MSLSLSFPFIFSPLALLSESTTKLEIYNQKLELYNRKEGAGLFTNLFLLVIKTRERDKRETVTVLNSRGKNGQRAGSACLRRTYVLSSVQTSILTLTPLLPSSPPTHTPWRSTQKFQLYDKEHCTTSCFRWN